MRGETYFAALGRSAFGGEESGSTLPQLVAANPRVGWMANSLEPPKFQAALFKVGSV